MKTLLISVLTATLLGLASMASGLQFAAVNCIAILFTTSLVAWTIKQYSHTPRPLQLARPIRVTSPIRSHAGMTIAHQQAA